MNVFHVYIHFPNNIENIVLSKKEGVNILKEFQMILDRADCEEGVSIYYNKSNKDSFLEELITLQDDDLLGNFGGYSFEESINILLNENDINNCENNPIHLINADKCYFKHWVSENREPTSDFPVIFKEIAERELRIENKEYEKQILINFSNNYYSENPINMIKDCRGIIPVFIPIYFVSNFVDLDNWFVENRIKRIFNFDDFRHIENHPFYINGKSPLLGGIGGKENAASILDKAIGDKRVKKYLVNFDSQNDCYIRYENENTNSTFHGYHLVKPISHDVDTIEINKIPQRIILILEYRKIFEV